jgi:PKD repeat protein
VKFDASVSHTYATAGVYTATLTATNNIGGMAAHTTVAIKANTYYRHLPLVLRQR